MKARIVIILALLVLGVGGYLGYQRYSTRNQQSDAIALGNSFVKNITEQEYDASFAQMNGAGIVYTGSLDNWIVWVNTAKRSDITFSDTPETVEASNFEKKPAYILTYPTDAGQNFIVTISFIKSQPSVSHYTVETK